MRKGSALASVCLVALASSAHADLVANGGFETGTFSGWTTFGAAGNVSSSAPIPHAGAYGAFFSSASTAGIRQTLAADVDDIIRLTFWLANRSGGSPTFFDAKLGGQTLITLSNAPSTGYTQYTFDVPVTAANPVLEFRFSHSPGRWDFDDVSAVNLVPLPMGAAMGLAGLAGVGLITRVRRRRGC
jgi:hypothetical protein